MSGRPSPRVALAAALGLALLLAIRPALSRPVSGVPAGGGRSASIVALGAADATVIAAPQPRTPGPLLLPLLVAAAVGLLVLRAWARPTAPPPRSPARGTGLDRWRARLVGAPPGTASSTSH
jgi:hypothetical protein